MNQDRGYDVKEVRARTMPPNGIVTLPNLDITGGENSSTSFGENRVMPSQSAPLTRHRYRRRRAKVHQMSCVEATQHDIVAVFVRFSVTRSHLAERIPLSP